MASTLAERLSHGIVLFDGAMGTMLYTKGIFINRCFDELNLSMPELVADVHRGYVEAGADVIETNTFGANRYKLGLFSFEDRVRDINLRGVELARQAIGPHDALVADVLVAGAIGPLGKPFDSTIEHEASGAFAEQASCLVEGGVDLLLLETFGSAAELEVAVRAVLSVCGGLPLIAQLSFNEDLKTATGDGPEALAAIGKRYPLAAIGANCSMGPQGLLDVIHRLAPLTELPISAQPNAGEPRYVDQRLLYLATPEYFAEYARRLIRAGARLVGGCCGTTPAHIRAMRSAVTAETPITVARPKIELPEVKVEAPAIEPVPTAQKGLLAAKLGKGFVVSVELDPPRGADIAKVLDSARALKKRGVDAINIADGPRASARMNPVSMALAIRREVDIETIIHYCCRDRNVLAMQADLIGCEALGLKNVLCVTGDPPKLGNYPFATGVFDVDSIGLLKIAANLNRGLDLAGNPLKDATSLLLGCGADPGSVEIETEIDRYRRKVEAGAEFLMTQPVYDSRLLLKFLERTQQWRIPTLVGILPLASYKNAEFLNNEVPGIEIPQQIMKRMAEAPSGDAARKEGIKIAQETLLETRDVVDGVYIMPPFNRHDVALRILEVL
ncbi:MAG: bifunctional homocysteine S-methyltransferase/methylenetetrahydrofolate reductase [Verrucomicrobia bacterium]|nr:bifunctional homocysteine S-methyltransferase/methylenetetrahydrofolate reductase [Verrucomicrobiota bacterium]